MAVRFLFALLRGAEQNAYVLFERILRCVSIRSLARGGTERDLTRIRPLKKARFLFALLRGAEQNYPGGGNVTSDEVTVSIRSLARGGTEQPRSQRGSSRQKSFLFALLRGAEQNQGGDFGHRRPHHHTVSIRSLARGGTEQKLMVYVGSMEVSIRSLARGGTEHGIASSRSHIIDPQGFYSLSCEGRHRTMTLDVQGVPAVPVSIRSLARGGTERRDEDGWRYRNAWFLFALLRGAAQNCRRRAGHLRGQQSFYSLSCEGRHRTVSSHSVDSIVTSFYSLSCEGRHRTKDYKTETGAPKFLFALLRGAAQNRATTLTRTRRKRRVSIRSLARGGTEPQ
mgnify:CR=1 FL=1